GQRRAGGGERVPAGGTRGGALVHGGDAATARVFEDGQGRGDGAGAGGDGVAEGEDPVPGARGDAGDGGRLGVAGGVDLPFAEVADSADDDEGRGVPVVGVIPRHLVGGGLRGRGAGVEGRAVPFGGGRLVPGRLRPPGGRGVGVVEIGGDPQQHQVAVLDPGGNVDRGGGAEGQVGVVADQPRAARVPPVDPVLERAVQGGQVLARFGVGDGHADVRVVVDRGRGDHGRHGPRVVGGDQAGARGGGHAVVADRDLDAVLHLRGQAGDRVGGVRSGDPPGVGVRGVGVGAHHDDPVLVLGGSGDLPLDGDVGSFQGLVVGGRDDDGDVAGRARGEVAPRGPRRLLACGV